MATYNISTEKNYVIYTDQSGSTIYDSGGPSGSYSNEENLYFLISPKHSSGSLQITVNSFSSENGLDSLRVYNGYSSDGTYADTVEGTNNLIKFITGNPTVPLTFTASSGRAYFRFSSDGSVVSNGFSLTWAAEQTESVNITSLKTNEYAITFPKSTAGSYIEFDKGEFADSSTLSSDKDIIFGFWAKSDVGMLVDTQLKGIFSIGSLGTQSPQLIFAKPGSSNSLRVYYRDSANREISMTSANAIIGGFGIPQSDNKDPPQWHHYGVVLRKTSLSSINYRVYRDGALFSSTDHVAAGPLGDISTTKDLVLSSYRDGTGGTIQELFGCWSGSFDDVFLATAGSELASPTTGSYNTFFSNIYNSGNWTDPAEVLASVISQEYNPITVLNWRFEETDIMLTKDYGNYGNRHAPVATSSLSPYLVSSEPGISYTPYSSLYYLSVNSFAYTSSVESYEKYDKNYVIGIYNNISLGYNRNTQQVPYSLNKKGTGKLRNL